MTLARTSSQQRLLTAARYSTRAQNMSRCLRKRGNCFLQCFPSAHGKISYLPSSSSSSMVFARYLATEHKRDGLPSGGKQRVIFQYVISLKTYSAMKKFFLVYWAIVKQARLKYTKVIARRYCEFGRKVVVCKQLLMLQMCQLFGNLPCQSIYNNSPSTESHGSRHRL